VHHLKSISVRRHASIFRATRPPPTTTPRDSNVRFSNPWLQRDEHQGAPDSVEIGGAGPETETDAAHGARDGAALMKLIIVNAGHRVAAECAMDTKSSRCRPGIQIAGAIVELFMLQTIAQ